METPNDNVPQGRKFKYIYSYRYPCEHEVIIMESLFAGKIPTVVFVNESNFSVPPQEDKSQWMKFLDRIFQFIGFGPKIPVGPYDGIYIYLMDPANPYLLYEYLDPYELWSNPEFFVYTLDVEPEWVNTDLFETAWDV